ncbi:hypothetical protein GGX14DRAFT_593430 [Mycena pura]|uniref:Uncharacterized protein n=1 Tax=Mycena pura TaxID=153505 RepID=A0AAD6Y3V0_9AGAR|nr:hypothetical protein GGX14DRAFT_593430 [Mycena pura]
MTRCAGFDCRVPLATNSSTAAVECHPGEPVVGLLNGALKNESKKNGLNAEPGLRITPLERIVMRMVLSCGAEDPLGDIYQDKEPFQPQILPTPLENPPPPSRKRKRSNGCDTILHYGAIVSPNNMWRAAEMQRGIIPLDDAYFSKAVQKLLLFGWKPCGCVRTGVGCEVCGNALGALFTPCQLHQESESGKNYYTILPSAVSPPIPPYEPPSPRPVPPRAVRPLPASPPRSYPRRRHPTSPPPLIFYADLTPTPSPEIMPSGLPAVGPNELAQEWVLMDESVSVVDEGEGDGDGHEFAGNKLGSVPASSPTEWKLDWKHTIRAILSSSTLSIISCKPSVWRKRNIKPLRCPRILDDVISFFESDLDRYGSDWENDCDSAESLWSLKNTGTLTLFSLPGWGAAFVLSQSNSVAHSRPSLYHAIEQGLSGKPGPAHRPPSCPSAAAGMALKITTMAEKGKPRHQAE